MASANIIIEAFSIVVSALILLFLILYKDYRERQGRLFIAMLVVNILVLLSDMLTWIFEGQPRLNKLLTAANFFVYVLGYVIVAFFTAYLVAVIGQKKALRRPRPFLYTVYALCAVASVMVFVSLFNGMYFRFNAEGMYERGPLYWFSQAFPIFMLLVNMAMILMRFKTLGTADALALLSYGVLPIIAMTVQIFVYGVTLLYISTTLSMLIIYICVQGEQRRRLQERETELVESQIALMVSQIQPHFIFNTLNSIRELMYIDTAKADEMIVNFSGFLRANINALQDTEIPFDEELKNVGMYVAIEKERFGNKLNFVEEIGVSDFSLPPLILQPLIENAVKHGICQKEEGGTVRLSTAEDGGGVLITIEDDGAGFDAAANPESSVGLNNVRSRIRYMLGTEMRIDSRIGEGTRIEISVPERFRR